MINYENDLNKLIKNEQENIFVDFKKEYHFEKKSQKAEFLKDCIGFLNADYTGDKYLIYGIEDNGKVIGGINTNNIKEEEIQELIKKYITPIPNIEIIKNYTYESKQLLVIVFPSINNFTLYSINKEYIYPEKNKQKGHRPGDSFVRRGTQIQKLSAKEASDLSNRTRSILSLLNVSVMDENNFKVIIEYADFLSKTIVNSDKLFDFINRDVNILKKFNDIFLNYVLSGKFNDIKEVTEVDGGINSLTEGIFYITTELFNLKKYFDFSFWSTVMTLKRKEKFTLSDFKIFEGKKNKINSILNSYANYQHVYGNLFFFNLTEINFDKETLNYFGQSKLSFTLSNDIIKLFMEPLYARENKLVVLIRELLQNSFDACKKSDNVNDEINVKFEYQNDILKYIYLEDNGIGMNIDDVTNYYLNIGNSSKVDSNEGLIGQFGIGALAMFLIGDKCVIRTKKKDQEECNFEIEKENFLVRQISPKDFKKGNTSYTSIKIEVSKEFDKYEPSRIKQLLDLESYIVSDKTKVSFDIGTEVLQAINIDVDGEDSEYFDIITFSNSSIYVLKTEEELKNSDLDQKVQKILRDKINRVLYNNQIGSIQYKERSESFRQLEFVKYINTNKLPLLIIKGKIEKSEGYITELSREMYTVTGDLLKKIAQCILSNNIPLFNELVQTVNESDESILERLSDINNLQNINYLKLDNFTFNRNGIRLWEDSDEIRTIYVNDISDDLFLSLLDAENIFDRKPIQSKRSSIAELIEMNEPLVISKRFYERFILKASSSANGFRMGSLKNLLGSIGLGQAYNYDRAQDLWNYINQNKSLIENQINKSQKNNLVFLNDKGKKIVERTSQVYDTNLIIVESKSHRKYPSEIKKFLTN